MQVLQGTCAAGVLHDVFGTELADRFFLGGPATLRGFAQRGVGPRADGLALGGTVSNAKFVITFVCQIHYFTGQAIESLRILEGTSEILNSR